MRFLFACGGTAGHINPALTVAATVKRYHPNAEILFAGNPHGMEARLVREAGYPFEGVVIKGFYRSFSPKSVLHNFEALGRIFTSNIQAGQIIRRFAPDVVIGTGGYASGPVLRRAAKMGIKTVTHEQNAFPGVTTKLLARYVDTVLLAVPEARRYLPEGVHTVVTGNPVRQEVLTADRAQSRERLGVGNRFCLLTFGGSLGAQRVNEAVADLIQWHRPTGRVHHIHATGQYGVELMPALLHEKGIDPSGDPHLDIREYIHDMPQCLAAADLVVCRAGAITLSELQAAGRASVLIPSPNVAENHQYHNAMVLQNAGAAIVIEEKELTGPKLCSVVAELVAHPDRLEGFSHAARSLAITDAAERIYAAVMELLG